MQILGIPTLEKNPGSFAYYRPISILSSLSKILECCHSTSLIHTADEIGSAMENGALTVTLPLDSLTYCYVQYATLAYTFSQSWFLHPMVACKRSYINYLGVRWRQMEETPVSISLQIHIGGSQCFFMSCLSWHGRGLHGAWHKHFKTYFRIRINLNLSASKIYGKSI